MEQEIENALTTLHRGEIILYPTDTVWGIGCDATNEQAVSKIFKLKNRSDSKSMICLVDSIEMLNFYVGDIPPVAFNLIEFSTRPTTIIYDHPKNIAKNLIAEDNSIGVRIVNDEFCKRLIKKLNRPLVSTSANISGTPTPKCFDDIQNEIKNKVDYIVQLNQDKISDKPSVIIKLKADGEVKIIRH